MMVSIAPLPGQKQKNCHSRQKKEKPTCQSLHHHHHHISLLSFLLFLLFLASCIAGAHAQRRGSKTYPLLAAIPGNTSFSCGGRTAGYYADMETGRQVYHMCDTLEKQYSFLCPNYTLFNQKFNVCYHWYMVNCTMAHSFFEPKGSIGKGPSKDMNTVDGGNNQSMRKSTIMAQKTQAVQSIKAIAPISMRKYQGTTKTTNAPNSRTTSRPTNPKSPFTTKSNRKTTSRPPITQTSLFTTKQFVSTTRRPLIRNKSPLFTTP